MSPRREVPTRRPRVLVVDDDLELTELLTMRLEHHGYDVKSASDAGTGLAQLDRGAVDAMILDLRLGDADGLAVLREVRLRAPEVPVVILTAHGTIETAVDAMRGGAYGFLTKPFHDHDLLQKLAHAVESHALHREVDDLRRILGEAPEHARLLGTSAPIAGVRSMIARIGPTDATVMLLGESGTGKELAARALHAVSPRRANPFVAINCAALPPQLLESELFGHVRGAFTGATSDREGLFGAARGGTLFLDEVGEATPSVQVKLLRVLQERRYTRVGATVEEEADVRVLAATNRELRAEVRAGRFREDLFYRLHVVPLALPPLRERVEDIPLLAEVFLTRAAARYKMEAPWLSRSALDALLAHSWPGNVRELANAMEAAMLLSHATELGAEHVVHLLHSTGVSAPAEAAGQTVTATVAEGAMEVPDLVHSVLVGGAGDLPPLREARDAFERFYVVEALRRSAGNVSAAARTAGRNRSDFYELLRRHGVSPASFKEP